LVSNETLKFNCFPIDFVCISKADAIAIETGKFKTLDAQEKREVKLREYILNESDDFPKRCSNMTQAEAWKELARYDRKIFLPLGQKAISKFFNETDLHFRKGAPKKNK